MSPPFSRSRNNASKEQRESRYQAEQVTLLVRRCEYNVFAPIFVGGYVVPSD
jgi:hypothetical protein